MLKSSCRLWKCNKTCRTYWLFFDDNCVWACSVIFCELSQQYMWSAFDVVKSGPKLSQPTKRHDTQLNLFDINGKLP